MNRWRLDMRTCLECSAMVHAISQSSEIKQLHSANKQKARKHTCMMACNQNQFNPTQPGMPPAAPLAEQLACQLRHARILLPWEQPDPQPAWHGLHAVPSNVGGGSETSDQCSACMLYIPTEGMRLTALASSQAVGLKHAHTHDQAL